MCVGACGGYVCEQIAGTNETRQFKIALIFFARQRLAAYLIKWQTRFKLKSLIMAQIERWRYA